MQKTKMRGLIFSGGCAGSINGLFGAGGGMILIPLLSKFTDMDEGTMFPSSIAMILPICLVSLCVSASHYPLPWSAAVPYLFGSVIGGILAGKFGKYIPVLWLHRILGIMILWGGVRYLC